VKIIAFQFSLFCKNYRFSKTVLYTINRKIHGCLEIPDVFLVLNMISHSFAALTGEISCSTLEIHLVFPRTHVLFSICYIVESEILKNTQWDIFHFFTSFFTTFFTIFHIFTSEDIDHVTFSIYTFFCLGLYNKQNITRWLEDMTFRYGAFYRPCTPCEP
jgi:hypothetical protein